MSSKGFTIMELLIVLAIIGILASIAIPSYCNYYGGRAEVYRALNEVKPLQVKIDNFLLEKKRLPAALSEINLTIWPVTKSKALESVNWYPKYAALLVKLPQSASNLTSGGQYLALTVGLNSTKTKSDWHCTTQHPLLANLNVIPNQHLPASCRPKT